MSFSQRRAALVCTAAATAALVGSTSSPALAATGLDAPLVVSAELLSAEGDGCSQPAIVLRDGWLDVEAQTGGDVSMLLDGRAAAGLRSVGVECVLRVHIQLDQPATVKASQYLMSGTVNTSAGTAAGHYFESSYDATHWYGQRSILPDGSIGPFYRGGGSTFDPKTICTTEADLFFRVGLSLTSAKGLAANDAVALDALNGAVAELVANSDACS